MKNVIEGVTLGSVQKKINQVADDTLLVVKAENRCLVKTTRVLNQFSNISGLSLNKEKSYILPIGRNKNPGWVTLGCLRQYNILSWEDTINYLGITIGNKNIHQQKVDVNMVQNTIDSLNNIGFTPSTRILQYKSMIASQLTYKFINTEHCVGKTALGVLMKPVLNFVWDGGRHRLSLETLQLPRSEGGFGLFTLHLFEESLKMKTILTMLQEKAQLAMWERYILEGLYFPLECILKCNTPMFRKFVRPGTIIPTFFVVVMKMWYKHFLIAIDQTVDMESISHIAICYNHLVTNFNQGDDYFHDFIVRKMYTWGALTALKGEKWHKFRRDNPQLCFIIGNLHRHLPEKWRKCILESSDFVHVENGWVDKMKSGKVSTSMLRNRFLHKTKPQYSNKWETELQKDTSNLPNPFCTRMTLSNYDDFHVQFIHRAYHLNNIRYRYSGGTDQCTFCENARETYSHLFWECYMVKPVWDLFEFVINSILELGENITIEKCLLAGYDSRVANTIAVICKHHIFVSRHKKQPVCLQILTAELEKYVIRVKHVKNQYKLWGVLCSEQVYDTIRDFVSSNETEIN